MRRQLILLLGSAVAMRVAVYAATPGPADGVRVLPLTSVAVPLDPTDAARTRVGGLRYMGGLVLSSTDKKFGGLSGLRAGPKGQMLAISDTGNWVGFVTVEHGDRLVGVRTGVIAPLLDADGEPYLAKDAGDAEGLEWDPATGAAMVSFEQDHRVQHYAGVDPAVPATLGKPPVKVTRETAAADWPKNGGGEAIATLADGARLIFEEDGLGSDGLSPVLLTIGGQTRQLAYRRPPGFKPSDAVALSPQEVLVLGRRFSPLEGMSSSVARVTVGPVMAAREVARLEPPMSVDNMEGIALRRSAGRIFVYLIADDNFNAWERVLLLKFELLP